MTKFNDLVVHYTDKHEVVSTERTEGEDAMLNGLVNAIFDAEDNITMLVTDEMRKMREAEEWKQLEGAAKIARALGISFRFGMDFPFPTDAYGRPIVYGRPSGAALDGFALGRNDCLSYVNYVVVPGTGKVYIEGAIDNPTACELTDTAVVDLDEAENYALNVLYSGFDAVLAYAWDGVDEEDWDDPEESEREDEETITRLKADIKAEVSAEKARLVKGEEARISPPQP